MVELEQGKMLELSQPALVDLSQPKMVELVGDKLAELSQGNVMRAGIRSEEVAQHDTPTSAWVVIEDEVFDLTAFLDAHPGGSEVLLESVGGDASGQFRDVGHSAEARLLLRQFLLGPLHKDDRTPTRKPSVILHLS